MRAFFLDIDPEVLDFSAGFDVPCPSVTGERYRAFYHRQFVHHPESLGVFRDLLAAHYYKAAHESYP